MQRMLCQYTVMAVLMYSRLNDILTMSNESYSDPEDIHTHVDPASIEPLGMIYKESYTCNNYTRMDTREST